MDKIAQKKGQKKRKEMEKMGKEFIMGKYQIRQRNTSRGFYKLQDFPYLVTAAAGLNVFH